MTAATKANLLSKIPNSNLEWDDINAVTPADYEDISFLRSAANVLGNEMVHTDDSVSAERLLDSNVFVAELTKNMHSREGGSGESIAEAFGAFVRNALSKNSAGFRANVSHLLRHPALCNELPDSAKSEMKKTWPHFQFSAGVTPMRAMGEQPK